MTLSHGTAASKLASSVSSWNYLAWGGQFGFSYRQGSAYSVAFLAFFLQERCRALPVFVKYKKVQLAVSNVARSIHKLPTMSNSGSDCKSQIGESFLMEDKYWKSKKRSNSHSNSNSKRRQAENCYFNPSDSSDQGRASFTRRCSSLVKEQRARFYIMRRCVSMLLCWHKYGDA